MRPERQRALPASAWRVQSGQGSLLLSSGLSPALAVEERLSTVAVLAPCVWVWPSRWAVGLPGVQVAGSEEIPEDLGAPGNICRAGVCSTPGTRVPENTTMTEFSVH